MIEEKKQELRRKWEEWLETIGKELGDLLISQDFFNEVCEIVNANSKIQTPSAFFGWIRDNYVDSVIIRIGRLNDHDQRTISLHRLIREISENPDVITRDYYVSGYSNKHLVEIGAADDDFDKFAEEGEQHISLNKVSKDIELLDRKTRLIKDFRDQWVAHFDHNREIKRLPTFNDVEEALTVTDEIFCKYYLLLTRGGITTRKPVLQYDWKEPLRHPWIEKPEREKG